MKYRKSTKDDYIDEPIEISLADALHEIDAFPTISNEGEFIGFENADIAIQFIRIDSDRWLLDVPHDTKLGLRSVQVEINTNLTKEIITLFSQGKKYTHLIPEYEDAKERAFGESSFCPIINTECKGSKCVFWNDLIDFCLLASYLTYLSRGTMPIPDEFKDEFEDDDAEEKKSYLDEKLVEEITGEILSVRENSGIHSSDFNILRDFWISKNIHEYRLTPELRQKYNEIESLVKTTIFENEKKQLPELCEKCITWARTMGFNRVRVSDVETFLLENNMRLSSEIRRALYSKVNTMLKAKK